MAAAAPPGSQDGFLRGFINDCFADLTEYQSACCGGTCSRPPLLAFPCPDGCGLTYCSAACRTEDAQFHARMCEALRADVSTIRVLRACCQEDVASLVQVAMSTMNVTTAGRPGPELCGLHFAAAFRGERPDAEIVFVNAFSFGGVMALLGRQLIQRWDLVLPPAFETAVLANAAQLGYLLSKSYLLEARPKLPRFVREAPAACHELLLEHGPRLRRMSTSDEFLPVLRLIGERILAAGVDPRLNGFLAETLRVYHALEAADAADSECLSLMEHVCGRISDAEEAFQHWDLVQALVDVHPACAKAFFANNIPRVVERLAAHVSGSVEAAGRLKSLIDHIIDVGNARLHKSYVTYRTRLPADYTKSVWPIPDAINTSVCGFVLELSRIIQLASALIDTERILHNEVTFNSCVHILHALQYTSVERGIHVFATSTAVGDLAIALGQLLFARPARGAKVAGLLLLVVFFRRIARYREGACPADATADAVHEVLVEALTLAPPFAADVPLETEPSCLATVLLITPDRALTKRLAKALFSHHPRLCQATLVEVRKHAKTPYALNNLCKRLEGGERSCGNAECSAARQRQDVVLSACSACKGAFYCSRECQNKHWPVHRVLCKTRKLTDMPDPSAGALQWTPVSLNVV